MPAPTPPDTLDFDLHGVVGVRLLGATAREADAVRRQLGPIERELEREPDITCRFVDRLEPRGPVRLIGLDDAGFTDDAYLVLRGRHKTPARVSLPMAELGGPCEIVCERGVAAVPQLIAAINLVALAKGHVPIHASAFLHEGMGVLVVGWAKGGKTETLLGFMANGARYIGDEWLYLAPDGTRMAGIPEPMKIWSAHLDSVPAFRRAVGAGDRVRMTAIDACAALGRSAAGPLRRVPGAGLVRRSLPLVERQAYVQVPPDRLFGPDRIDLAGPLDVVVLALSHDHPDVTVEAADAAEVAGRMAASVQHERLELWAHYLKFRFAFPDARNGLLEEAEQRERQLLVAALRGKRAFVLRHPYPAPIPKLYEALAPCLR